MQQLTMGQAVRVKFTPLEGTVSDAALNKDTLAVIYKVDYTDNDGQPQNRFFEADQLEAIAP